MCKHWATILVYFFIEHTAVSCNKSDINNRTSSRGFDSPRRSFSKHDDSVDDWPPVSDDPFDSEWGISSIIETADRGREPKDGWTVVKSKSQKSKSVAESTLFQNQHSFQNIGSSQDVSSCKGSKWREHENKSNTRQTSSPNWPSLPGPSFEEGNSSSNTGNFKNTNQN